MPPRDDRSAAWSSNFRLSVRTWQTVCCPSRRQKLPICSPKSALGQKQLIWSATWKVCSGPIPEVELPPRANDALAGIGPAHFGKLTLERRHGGQPLIHFTSAEVEVSAASRAGCAPLATKLCRARWRMPSSYSVSLHRKLLSLSGKIFRAVVGF